MVAPIAVCWGGNPDNPVGCESVLKRLKFTHRGHVRDWWYTYPSRVIKARPDSCFRPLRVHPQTLWEAIGYCAISSHFEYNKPT